MPDFSSVSWAAPLAGAVIGAVAAATVVVATLLHLPTLVVAVVAVGGLAMITGALHEDGLADTADGFAGGVTREQKLAIMRDSRLGTYGALALILSTLLRVAALSTIAQHGVLLAAVALVSLSASSRAVGLIPLVMLFPARGDGAGASAATPTPSAMRQALVIGVAFGLTPALAGASLAQAVAAVAAGFGAAIAVSKLAERQIGGYTGDVLGAAQQAAEIGALLCLCV